MEWLEIGIISCINGIIFALATIPTIITLKIENRKIEKQFIEMNEKIEITKLGVDTLTRKIENMSNVLTMMNEHKKEGIKI